MYKYRKPNKRFRESDPFAVQTGRHKTEKLDSSYRRDWAEDVFVSDSEEKETLGKSFNFNKLPLLGAALAVLLAVILGKTAWLQIAKGEYYYKMAEGNRIRIERIEPRRGVIYDRKLRRLVGNSPNFLLYVVPADLPEGEKLDELVNKVAGLLDSQKADQIRQKIEQVDRGSLEAYQPLFIADTIPYEKAMKLYLKSSEWPGVVLSNRTRRSYNYVGVPFPGQEKKSRKEEPRRSYSLSHILGYTGKINQKELEKFGEEYLPIDYIGKMGIEYFWENELKGKSGKKQIEVDALGKEKKIIGRQEAQDGHNLILSLDVQMQLKLEEVIKEHLSELESNKAAGIVMDPANGEILSMVSVPAYNNNLFARGITQKEYQTLISEADKPLINRCISGEYPSGSTIKPVIAAAALEEGIINEHTSFVSTGGISVGKWRFPDWRPGGHGVVDVRRAIAESVNTFFYYIGGGYEDFTGLGVDRIVHYGEKFGLGSQTGIDLAGEASGNLPTPEWKKEVKGEPWYIGDTYHLAIGQGDLLATPLQVAAFTNVFANGGKLYRPHFIQEVLNSNDKTIRKTSDRPVREDFIDDHNITVVKQGMRRAVTSGSARRLQSVPAEVSGKTGTAQWSSQKKHHAWFTGFAPYDDPGLTITILVEQGGEGSYTAVPIAEDFLKWYFGEYKSDDK